jgi:hypothetical protein
MICFGLFYLVIIAWVATILTQYVSLGVGFKGKRAKVIY